MKIAIAHDYLVQMGGAERVVEVFHQMYPSAPIYTTMFSNNRLLDELRDADIRASWLQKCLEEKVILKKCFLSIRLRLRILTFENLILC